MIGLLIVLAFGGLAHDPYVQDGWQPPPPPPVKIEQAPPQLQAKRDTSRSVEEWRPLVAGHFEPGDVDRVLCLMGYESGGDPNAHNPSGATGLMQIMPFWAHHFDLAASDLYTPEINLWVARKVRDEQGWTAWSPYNRGKCH